MNTWGGENNLNAVLTYELELDGDELLDSRSGCFIKKKVPSLATKQMDICDSGLSGNGREMNILLCLPEIEEQLDSSAFKIHHFM
jgi:hypothetical protein